MFAFPCCQTAGESHAIPRQKGCRAMLCISKQTPDVCLPLKKTQSVDQQFCPELRRSHSPAVRTSCAEQRRGLSEKCCRVSRLGIEPRTLGLKGRCSTS